MRLTKSDINKLIDKLNTSLIKLHKLWKIMNEDQTDLSRIKYFNYESYLIDKLGLVLEKDQFTGRPVSLQVRSKNIYDLVY